MKSSQPEIWCRNDEWSGGRKEIRYDFQALKEEITADGRYRNDIDLYACMLHYTQYRLNRSEHMKIRAKFSYSYPSRWMDDGKYAAVD
jgi:hypothetical protein